MAEVTEQTITTDEAVENVVRVLGDVMGYANTHHIGRQLHDRLKATSYPNDTGQRCLFNMLRELAMYLGKE